MKDIFSSASSRFRLACSLVYASAQLLKMFCVLLLTASRNDWRSRTKSQLSLHLENLQNIDAPLDDPDDWIPEDLTEEEITQIWLSMLDEPDVQQSCTHHLNRCYETASHQSRDLA